MAMSASASSTHLKQMKASPAERINGKVKVPNKLDQQQTQPQTPAPNGTVAKPTSAPQQEASAQDARRKASGRSQLSFEEQKQQMRKRVEMFIPTINVRNSTTNILAKYRESAPSLTVHLHPTHFRLDQQDGTFSYNSPMRVFLEYIRDEQIPAELVDLFKLGKIKFYDNCLIVEVQDHRPRGPPVSTTSRGGPFVTPSQNASAAQPAPQPVSNPSKEQTRVYRTLLRHTEQSLWHDFGHLAENTNGEFTDWMGVQVEGGLMLAMQPRLVLDLPGPTLSRKRIFETVFNPVGQIPPRKKAKRESSKAADDSAERAAEEKLMLLGDGKQYDKDFQPRFQILGLKEDWKKRKAEEEKNKDSNGNQPTSFVDMLSINEGARAKPAQVATVDTIQAQTQAQTQAQLQTQQAQTVQSKLPQTGLGISPQTQTQIPHPVQQPPTQGISPTPNPPPQPPQRRVPLPRQPSQDRVATPRPTSQAGNIPRQLQPTASAAANAPTPHSGSPQVPVQRLPQTPRNVPGTPRPPGTPQPPPAKHPTPQATTQAMTPASTQPSPMLKSTSQGDDPQLQQMNGIRQQLAQRVQQQGAATAQQRPTVTAQQFFEILKMHNININYDQFVSLPAHEQQQLTGTVQAYMQKIVAQQQQQQGNAPGNQQTVQEAYQQAQMSQQMLQAQQRNAMQQLPQQLQGMTPDQKRIFAQNKQQFLGIDGDILRHQLAQGRPPQQPDNVQAMFHQHLLARQQNPQQAGLQPQQPQQSQQPQQPQQQPQAQTPTQQHLQQALAQARQLALQQAVNGGQLNAIKLSNGQTMTPEQINQYRARQVALHQQQQQRQQQLAHTSTAEFMNSLDQQQRTHFQGLDGNTQQNLYRSWVSAQVNRQQQVVAGVPQLQYNPMAAQNMGGVAARIPNPMAMAMAQQAQAQGGPNGMANGSPAMMRQSTSGGQGS